jgi:hypothetical protein
MQKLSVKEAPSEAALLSASQRPETFRLPKSGEVDRFFGLSRSFYYEGESRGYWKLLRVRQHGKLRGVTLIPFDEVAAFIHAQNRRATDSDELEETEIRLRSKEQEPAR